MPYRIFHELYWEPLRSAPFSLQLADGFETRPLSLIKIGVFRVLEDFIIADMTKFGDAQIILGRPFLATSGCIIDVKGGRITFEVGGIMLHFVLWMRNLFPLTLP